MTEGLPTVSRVAVYPGSFDPLTNGHVDIILRGARLFDRIIVAMLVNAEKRPLFRWRNGSRSCARRSRAIPNVEVDHVRRAAGGCQARRKVPAIVRGLRAVSDFEYEIQMALMNRHLGPPWKRCS